MTFIITLIALMMERFFHWHHLRHWRWFIDYEEKMGARLGNLPPAVILIICLLPPLIIVGLITYVLHDWFYGIFDLIFGVLVMLYCLGPENLWVQVYQGIQYSQNNEVEKAVAHVQMSFGIQPPTDSQLFHQSFVRAIFIAAYQRIFSVIFWFVILGPIGAVLYRLIELFSLRSEMGMSSIAMQVKQFMDWIPVRLFAFLFALGGHFTKAFACWKNDIFRGINANEKILAECGIASLDITEGDAILDTVASEQAAIALLDRVSVIALVILAVIVLMAHVIYP